MNQLLIKNMPAEAQWNRIGCRHHHGINIPLFSLYSHESAGIGEYPDLLPLLPWCRDLGLDVIQLLPLNDTGKDLSPYGALSAFALNPMHLGLAHLPFVKEDEKLRQLLQIMQGYSQSKRVEYDNVRPHRDYFLRNYYRLYGDKIRSEPAYQQFIRENRWLDVYALYKALKIAHHDASWETWSLDLQLYSPELASTLFPLHQKEMAFQTFVQYLCFEQLKNVKKVAEENQVFLKGDLPILINRDSADVWSKRVLFHLNYSAGAPPDMYAEEGQVWGFPIYNWEEMERDGFAWWKERLAVAGSFYHIYRLDHLVGFFRIWAVPLGKSGKEGIFIPSDQGEMLSQGTKIMNVLLSSSSMMPIAEDLGTVPPEVRKVLDLLGIGGTRVIRWERFWEKDKSFIPYSQYNAKSMSTVSTHDSETLRSWWTRQPDEARMFAAFKGWEYRQELTSQQQYEIMKDSHHTNSFFHVNLLQEYFDLLPGCTNKDPEQERVNIPGLISPLNWTYKFPLSVEKIVAMPELKKLIQNLIA